MDGLGPAAQFPIIYYTIARFQVYLKKIKKKRNFVHQFEKKKRQQQKRSRSQGPSITSVGKRGVTA
jgi:hypothetical protein